MTTKTTTKGAAEESKRRNPTLTFASVLINESHVMDNGQQHCVERRKTKRGNIIGTIHESLTTVVVVELCLTGTLSGYFFRIFSPSVFLFSKTLSSLYWNFIVNRGTGQTERQTTWQTGTVYIDWRMTEERETNNSDSITDYSNSGNK